MPPHGGHHGGGHRGGRGGGFRRGFGGRTVVLDYGPDYFDPGCVKVLRPDGTYEYRCPPTSDAMGVFRGGPYLLYSDVGDIFPTSPQLIRSAVVAEDGNWNALYAAMITALASGKVTSVYTNGFTDKRAGWQFFRDSVLADTPISSDEASRQIDQWKNERANWAKDLESKSGVSLPILDQAPPPQAPPTTAASLLDKSTGLILAGAALAAILVFGPHFSK